MKTANELKEIVRSKYNEIVTKNNNNEPSSCCTPSCCTTEVYHIMSEDYTNTTGYIAEADLGLGCGLPTHFAKIKKGDTVIDLGSGAGNDCFVARAEAGTEGTIIGIDFTPAMVEKAKSNAAKLGFTNVHFKEGDIESMPLDSNCADVVVSNCVLNLVPNKEKVFQEIFRVLKPGGHFSISDIVIVGDLPDALRKDAEMYAGCVSGAIQKTDYLQLITINGFKSVRLQKEKMITIPEEILKKYLSTSEIKSFQNGTTGIFSITVYAEKPTIADDSCCQPNCCS